MLTSEQELIIMLNRLSFDKKVEDRINELVLHGVNWFELTKLSMYHKNSTLWWKNLKKICPQVKLPKYLDDALSYIYYGVCKKNQYYKKEVEDILAATKKNRVIVIPVKGTMLIPKIYKDFGVRYIGDADFLVRHCDIEILDSILTNELGYVKGEYSFKKNKIESVSRKDEIMWNIYMSNIFPYCKLVAEKGIPLKFIKLDFRFALDDSLRYETVDKIINYYEKTGVVKPAHILIHLCTHFYNEAKYTLAIKLYKDLNMIKLCDIREYIIQYMGKEELLETIRFAKEFQLEKALFYTFHWLNLVYGDGYEKNIIEKLKIENDDFLTTFGKNIYDNSNKFNSTELERLFSCDNTTMFFDK